APVVRGLVLARGAACWRLLSLLALGGRYLGGDVSQWHYAHGRWGQCRGFSGGSMARGRAESTSRKVEQRMPGTRFIAVKVPLKK
ncbi:hypothetical protein EI555_014733, partial [Monodon monoceros]